MATKVEQPVVSGYSGAFGWPLYATVGQTITVPSTDSVLDEFTFYYQSDFTDGPIVRGEVYPWDGAKATGAGLWESPPRQLMAARNTPTPVTFQTGGVALIPNERYVLFVSLSRDYQRNVAEVDAGINDYSSWGTASAADNGGVDPYPGGDYVVLDNEGDTAAWTTRAWKSFAQYQIDMQFSATFITATGGCSCLPSMLGVLGAAWWLTSRRGRRSW